MPPLSEFLGHLMSEIARARALADVESTRIARMYADDPLLKHLSVPRFRLPDLTIDVPMVINAVDGGEQPQPQPPVTNLRGVFQEIVEAQLERIGAKAKKGVLTGIRRKFGEIFSGADDAGTEPADMDAAREKMIGDFLPHLPKELGIDPPFFANLIREAWREKFGVPVTPKPPAQPRLEVAFTPEALQAARPENVTKFHLVVKENGIEWTSLERNGEVEQRLVAE